MLELKNVKKKFNDTLIFDNVNISFPSNGLFSLLGKSGSGKSTLLNLMSGYLEPDDGEILYNGKNISNFDNKEKKLYRKQVISFIFQDFFLIDDFNVIDNILIGKEFSESCDSNKALEIMKKLEIDILANKYPNELSGGERQRVAIARALYRDTPIIFADEPTGNLDEAMSNEIYGLLKDISKDKLIIVVSHDLNINNYSDGVIETSKISFQNYNFDENNEIIEETNELKSKIPFKYGRRLLKRKRKIMHASFCILSLSLFILLIFVSFIFINPHNAEYKAYKKENINQLVYSLNGLNEELMEHSYDTKYDKLDVKDYYLTTISINLLVKDVPFIYSDVNFSSTICNIIIDDSIEDNKIILSHYLMEACVHYNLFSDEQDLIENSEWDLNTVTLTVKSVDAKVDLDYKKYSSDYRLNYIKISHTTFENMNNYKNFGRDGGADVYYNQRYYGCTYNNENLGLSTVEGSYPTNDDEIVITKDLAVTIEGDTIIGTTYSFCGKDYKIVGILYLMNTPLLDIVFTYDEFNRVANEFGYNYERGSYSKGIIVTLNDKEQAIALSKEMFKKDIFATSTIKDEVYRLVANIYISKGMVWLFTAIFCLIEIILVALTLKNIFNSLEKEVTIFFSFGASIKESFMAVVVPMLVAVIGYGLLSVLLYIGLMPVIDSVYQKIVEVPFGALEISPISILISISIYLGVFMYAAFIGFINLKKKNLLDLLYNRK